MVLTLLTLLMIADGPAQAQEVYVCPGENGRKEYRNTGITRDCKRLDIPSVTTIPAPPARKATAPVQTSSARPAASPADFPKVDSQTQKARDSDRRQILTDEMRTEEQKLAELRREFNNGEPERRGDERNYAKYQERVASLKDNLARTEKNIDALKREIGNLK